MTDQVRPEDTEALIVQFQKSDVKELHIRFEGFEIYLSKDGNAGELDAPVQIVSLQTVPSPAAAATPLAAAGKISPVTNATPVETTFPAHMIVVRAAYLGTFYRSPKPGAAPYVEVGSEVTPGTDLCLIEVMKLFTAIRVSVKGRVHQILARDGEMVREDQPLFVIDTE